MLNPPLIVLKGTSMKKLAVAAVAVALIAAAPREVAAQGPSTAGAVVTLPMSSRRTCWCS